MDEKSIRDLENFFDEDKEKFTNKDFGIGFFIGSVMVFALIFSLFILKKMYDVIYENYVVVLLPIILFLICIILIGSAFKMKRDKIAYGLITAIFALPMIFVIIWFLTFMIIA